MPTIFTHMKRMFTSKPAQELLTRPPSHGGSYQLTKSSEILLNHRRLKRGNPWPGRIHRILNLGLFFSFLATLAGVWLSVACCAQNDAKASQDCFTVAIWASSVLTVILLSKVVWNARHPQN